MTPPQRRKVAKSRGVKPVSILYQAREHAQAWYSCVREWDVYQVEVPASPPSNPQAGKFKLVGIAYGGGSGQHGLVRVPRLQTPIGWIGEGELGAAISHMARSSSSETAELGKRLERVRQGFGIQRLTREGGWVHPRDTARAYALAVLTLAVQFGDSRADRLLQALRKEIP